MSPLKRKTSFAVTVGQTSRQNAVALHRGHRTFLCGFMDPAMLAFPLFFSAFKAYELVFLVGGRPVCVVVTAKADNPGKKEVLDAAVFGRIFDEDGTSVVANNPDSNTDAGQFAIVDKIAPGKSEISFQFIAAIDPAQDFSKKRLEFESLKAISYPGGARYKEITECDMNPLGEGCDF
ncbi:unnamed protein product [Phaeothamnion confervicola]